MARDLPVRPLGVSVYLVRGRGEEARYLFLRRQPDEPEFPGIWQQVAGGIEPGESAVEAAFREVQEETSIPIDALYSADLVETFYDASRDAVLMLPVFVAFLGPGEVVLSDEHDAFDWLGVEEACGRLAFRQQRTSLRAIDEDFIRAQPLAQLRLPRPGG